MAGERSEAEAEAGMDPVEEKPEREFRCYFCGGEIRSATTMPDLPCPHCGHNIRTWRARVAYAGQSEIIRRLARDGPVAGETVPNSTTLARELVFALRPPMGTQGGTSKRRDWRTAVQVLYLPGQERAAVTTFIEANEAFVADCLSDNSNPLRSQWDEEFYQLLVEQWHWLGKGTAVPFQEQDDEEPAAD